MQTSEETTSGARAVTVPPALDKLTAYSWRFLVIVAAVYVTVLALARLRLLVIPVIVALLLTTLLAPPVTWLRGKGVPKLAATWLVIMISIGLLGGLFAFIAPQVVDQFSHLGRDLKAGSEQALEWLAEGPLGISEREVHNFIDQAAQRLRENSGTLTQGALMGAVKAVEVIAATILVIVVTFFFVKDGPEMWSWLVGRLPARSTDVEEIGQRSWTTLGAYIRGTALIALTDAVLIGLALWIVGVPLVLPLALLTFFGAFFPVVGAFVAGLVAVLVALAAGGFGDALIIGIVITAIQQLEGDLLQPLIIGRAVRLHPIVVLLSLTAGGILAGVAGAFLAVPIAAVASTVGNYLRTSARP